MDDKAPTATLPPPALPPKGWRQLILRWVGALTLVLGAALVSGYFWYHSTLTPVDTHSTNKVRFEVEEGETTSRVSQKLQQAGLIRSSVGFRFYLKFNRPDATLQTGRYALSRSYSVEKIVAHLQSGKTDLFFVTILPGATLEGITAQLQKYGYSQTEIKQALSSKYPSPLLTDKPVSADLEGYIFPETYQIGSGDTLSVLFQRDFETLHARLQKDGLIEAFKVRGLNLHQALTLASIIQQEADRPEDQRQVAQVFYKRLAMNMKLESDVTFLYAAKKLDVTPTIDLDSPYNTRRYPGLPPGPISNMNYSALQAVAVPASGDYLYFVAGDDGTVYFARTFEEHEANIKSYCHKLCE